MEIYQIVSYDEVIGDEIDEAYGSGIYIKKGEKFYIDEKWTYSDLKKNYYILK